jgi:hypothetical protein
MGAYDEFRRSGRLGDQGARLLYATVASIARLHRYPPSAGHSSWTADAVEEVAHDFLTSERADRRLTYLYMSAVDEESFRRLLGTAVLNHFRSAARRTMLGRLIRRLNDVLAGSDDFRRATGAGPNAAWWTLAEGLDEPSACPTELLTAAAAHVRDVRVPRWSDTAARRPPDADRDSLVRLARRVLEAAGGAVAVSDLARAIAPRLGLGSVPLVVDTDVQDLSEALLPVSGDRMQGALDALRADELFASLSERERLVVAYWEEPVRDFAPRIGLGKSQASAARQRVVEFLRVGLTSDDNPDDVVRLLVARAKRWAEGRTDRHGAASV